VQHNLRDAVSVGVVGIHFLFGEVVVAVVGGHFNFIVRRIVLRENFLFHIPVRIVMHLLGLVVVLVIHGRLVRLHLAALVVIDFFNDVRVVVVLIVRIFDRYLFPVIHISFRHLNRPHVVLFDILLALGASGCCTGKNKDQGQAFQFHGSINCI